VILDPRNENLSARMVEMYSQYPFGKVCAAPDTSARERFQLIPRSVSRHPSSFQHLRTRIHGPSRRKLMLALDQVFRFS